MTPSSVRPGRSHRRLAVLFGLLLAVLLGATAAARGAQQKTVYLAPDEHTDYFWTADAATYRQVFLDMIDYYLDLADATQGEPEDFQSRFALDGSLWLWEYQHARSDAEFLRVVRALRTGHLSAPLNALASCYGGTPAEAVLRGMYYSGRLERRFGLRFPLAVAMENQTLPFGLSSLWAGSGARYSWRGICDCSSAIPDAADRDHEIYWSTGPDGQRVLMKWNSMLVSNRHIGGYAEAYDPFAIVDFVDSDPEFLRRYPYDVIGCFGRGWDHLETKTDEFVKAAKAKTTSKRRVVVSNEEDFFRHFEAAYGANLPVVAQSFGNEWDLLCASLEAQTARVRRAVELLRSAEAMATVVSTVAPHAFAGGKDVRDRAFLGLGLYWEHDWTADGPVGRDAREGFQREVADDVERYSLALHDAARHQLGRRIARPDPARPRFFVFNALGHRRTDVAEIDWKGPVPVEVVDVSSGVVVPSELAEVRGRRRLRVLAADVPALGYRVYEVRSVTQAGTGGVAGTLKGGVVETARHRLVLRGDGAISSWQDRSLGGRELIASIDGRVGNDLRGAGDGGTLRVLHAGPLSITVEARTGPSLRRRSTFTLYRDLPRIDVVDEILENFSSVEAYAFSFDLDQPVTHFEEVGAIAIARRVADGGDLADRAARTDWLTAQHFVDVSSATDPVGVTVANRDASFFRLGRSDTANLDTATPRIDFLAGGQVDGPSLGILDQGGDTHFVHAFSLVAHDGYDPAEAMRFALEATSPLGTGWVTGEVPTLPAEKASWFRCDDPAVLLWAAKPAEEGIEDGVVLRLWNVSEQLRAPRLGLGRLPAAAVRRTTHLETDLEPVPVLGDGRFRGEFAGQQIQTYRVLPADD